MCGTLIAFPGFNILPEGKVIMFKTVSFNIFDMELEDVVYQDEEVRSGRAAEKKAAERRSETADRPILKPPYATWKKENDRQNS